MNCKEVSENIIDYLDKNLDNQISVEIENHILTCSECKKEMQEMSKVLFEIEHTQNLIPDDSLRRSFIQILEKEKDENSKPKENVISIQFLRKRIFLQTAAAMILLLLGFYGGLQYNSLQSNSLNKTDELAEMKNDVSDMKELLVMNLMKEESASQRIKAINYTEEIQQPNSNIIDVLINTLNSDKNSNVRLAAVYSLARFKDNEKVIDAFITTLNQQDDPMVQIVIINLLVEIQEVKAVDEFKGLLKKEDLNETVRSQVEIGIKVLS